MTSSGPQDELFRKMCGQTTTSVLDEGPEKEGPKSPQAVEPEFQLYSHVKLVNLQNRPEMNDHIGVVRSTKNASGRFGVSLLRTKQWKSKGLPGDPIAIKAQNLEAVAPFDTLSLGAIKKIYGAKSEQFWNPRGYDYIRKCGRFPGASTVRAALCETAEQQAKAWDDSEEGQYWRRVGAQGSTDHARGERYQAALCYDHDFAEKIWEALLCAGCRKTLYENLCDIARAHASCIAEMAVVGRIMGLIFSSDEEQRKMFFAGKDVGELDGDELGWPESETRLYEVGLYAPLAWGSEEVYGWQY